MAGRPRRRRRLGMDSIRLRHVVERDGELLLTGLPCKQGQEVEVSVPWSLHQRPRVCSTSGGGRFGGYVLRVRRALCQDPATPKPAPARATNMPVRGLRLSTSPDCGPPASISTLIPKTAIANTPAPDAARSAAVRLRDSPAPASSSAPASAAAGTAYNATTRRSAAGPPRRRPRRYRRCAPAAQAPVRQTDVRRARSDPKPGAAT